jgi:undecaprenyl diphosphate synthase
MSLPAHIVIIPDGNRRWAKKGGKPPFFGHRAGMRAMEKIADAALKMEIPCLTAWGSSVANITERSPAEVKFLFALFEAMFKKLAKRKELKHKGIRVRVLGRWQEFFPESLKKAIHNVVRATEKNDRHNFTLLMAYDGRDEMLAAVRKISASGKEPALIDRDTLKENLWSADLPPVDLVIRTGGEPHWSAGMMMWDVAEARLYFTETLWPDFSPKEFQKALDYYAKTERRHGK